MKQQVIIVPPNHALNDALTQWKIEIHIYLFSLQANSFYNEKRKLINVQYLSSSVDQEVVHIRSLVNITFDIVSDLI